MATRRFAAAEDHGARRLKFGIDGVFPFLGRVIAALDRVHTGFISKVASKSKRSIGRRCTRRRLLEIHFHRLCAVQHQGCHSIGGFAQGVIGIVIVLHLVPAKVHWCQCRHVDVQALACVGRYGHCGTCGPFPVIHHLSHCRGHTSCRGMLGADKGELDIVGVTLCPIRGDHRSDGRA